MNTSKRINGLNVQWPWSQLLLSGKKTIETRNYPIPAKHLGVPIALIETPGKKGKAVGAVSKSRIIGVVIFSECYKYADRDAWLKDFKGHRVAPDDSDFAFKDGMEKWAWVVKSVAKLNKPIAPPNPRGIVFCSGCRI